MVSLESCPAVPCAKMAGCRQDRPAGESFLLRRPPVPGLVTYTDPKVVGAPHWASKNASSLLWSSHGCGTASTEHQATTRSYGAEDGQPRQPSPACDASGSTSDAVPPCRPGRPPRQAAQCYGRNQFQSRAHEEPGFPSKRGVLDLDLRRVLQCQWHRISVEPNSA